MLTLSEHFLIIRIAKQINKSPETYDFYKTKY